MNKRSWLRPFVAAACAVPVAGTLLSLSRRTHWIFRMWDFPRVQIAALAAIGATAYRARFYRGRPDENALLALDAATIAWQLYHIKTYTPLVPPTVKRVDPGDVDEDNRIVLLMTNVQMENEQYHKLLATVDRADPDVILAVEVDERWSKALEPLREKYPHTVWHPQDNWYGMILLSRFELLDPRVEFLVQEDIPSIHTRLRLPSGVEVTMHGLHPRPPEPIRDQPSSPRDAELVVIGRSIGEDEAKPPTIVAGDLNDVAWSPTSELFVRLSGLLDPRAGRGFYNSYNARNPLFRYPLDHLFHSTHFKLVRIDRLPPIGSDHFPILVELQYDPHAPEEQDESHELPGDQEFADEKLAQEARDKATGEDRPRE